MHMLVYELRSHCNLDAVDRIKGQKPQVSVECVASPDLVEVCAGVIGLVGHPERI